MPMNSAATYSIIITGGNTGLGFETAKVIGLDKNAMVVIACRNPKFGQDAVARLTAFGGHCKVFLPLDLASQDIDPEIYRSLSQCWPSATERHHLQCRSAKCGCADEDY